MYTFIINKFIEEVYNKNLEIHGFTHSGVFWNSKYNQFKRYEELISYIPKSANKILIMDVGCGYGALYEYLKEIKQNQRFYYFGIDINKKLIKQCKIKYPEIDFYHKPKKGIKVDYILFSGTYNLAVTDNMLVWENYILNDLYNYSKFCNKIILLNLQFSDKCKIVNNIYYTTTNRISQLLGKKFKNYKIVNSKYFSRDIIIQIFLD